MQRETCRGNGITRVPSHVVKPALPLLKRAQSARSTLYKLSPGNVCIASDRLHGNDFQRSDARLSARWWFAIFAVMSSNHRPSQLLIFQVQSLKSDVCFIWSNIFLQNCVQLVKIELH